MGDSERTIDKFLFRETFESEYWVGHRGGVMTSVALSHGIAITSTGDISYPDIFLPKSGGWSMRCIFKHDLSSIGTLFASNYAPGEWTRVKINTNGSISIYNDNAGISVSSLGMITTNTWHDLVITNDLSGSSNIRFYVDGNLVNINSQTSIWNKVNSLFSRGDGVGDFLDGECALAEIYSSVLSANEVANIHDNRRFREIVAHPENTLNLLEEDKGSFDIDTEGWVKYGNNTIEHAIEQGNNVLKITYNDNDRGGYVQLIEASDLTSNLIWGKRYRLRIRMKVMGGAETVACDIYNGTGYVEVFQLTTSFVWHEHEYYCGSLPENSLIRFDNLGAGESIYIDQWSIEEVSAYDIKEILSVSAQSGSIVDRWDNALTNTDVVVKKSGEVNAMKFDGSTSNIDCGSDVFGIGDKSVVLWMRPQSYGEGGGGRIMENGNLKIYIGSNLLVGLMSDGSTIANSGSLAYNFSEWSLVVVTRAADGTTNFYINGEAAGTADQDSGTPAAGTGNLLVGNRAAGDRTFDGLMNDIRIISGILLPPEISQLFSSEKRKYNG